MRSRAPFRPNIQNYSHHSGILQNARIKAMKINLGFYLEKISLRDIKNLIFALFTLLSLHLWGLTGVAWLLGGIIVTNAYTADPSMSFPTFKKWWKVLTKKIPKSNP